MRPRTLLALVTVLFVRTACLSMSLRLFAVVVLLFMLLAGCTQSNLQRGLDLGQKTLAVIDVGAEHAGQTLRTGTQAAADACRTLHPGASKPERDACMAKAGLAPADLERAEVALRVVSDAYDQIAEALATIERVAPEITSALEAAKEAQ